MCHDSSVGHDSFIYVCGIHMGWLRLVGSLKLQVSFAEYRLFYRAVLQKRPIILRSLLIVATPYLCPVGANAQISEDLFTCDMTQSCVARDSFICGMTHSYVIRDSFICGMHTYIYLRQLPTLELRVTHLHVI